MQQVDAQRLRLKACEDFLQPPLRDRRPAFVHLPNGWLFSAPNGGREFPVFWSAALIAQALLGPGAYALRPALPRAPARAAA